IRKEKPTSRQRERGVSSAELLIVVAIVAVISVVAIPQLGAARRQFRFTGVQNEVATLLRYTRQQAMSQRQAFTFQYDDTNKQIVVIDHETPGTGVLGGAGYPNTAGSRQDRVVSLIGGGMRAEDIVYGRPQGVAAEALDDTANLTALSGGRLNITFQPDGSVRDAANNPVNRALMLYNRQDPQSLAGAISVLGAAGRVKTWRYVHSGNKYVE
ncbi:MAG: GspH/FimT family pseudopilin, partial [Pyrinomonadaceae bacterium]